MEYRSSSPPALIPPALAAINTGATSAGDRPGERYTADTPCPSTRLASKAPATKRTCGSACCSTASCGGAARVSATVTRAPQRTHQRAIARPEAPRPRMRTCRPCSGSAALPPAPAGQPAGTGARSAGARAAAPAAGTGTSCSARAPAPPCGAGLGSGAGASAGVLPAPCALTALSAVAAASSFVSARPVSAKMRATKSAASRAAVSAGAGAGTGAAAGACHAGCAAGCTAPSPPGMAGAVPDGNCAGCCSSKGGVWFIAVSGWTGPPGTRAW